MMLTTQQKRHRQLDSSTFARTPNLTQSTAKISIVFSFFSTDMEFHSDCFFIAHVTSRNVRDVRVRATYAIDR